jgi:hypothetical protein
MMKYWRLGKIGEGGIDSILGIRYLWPPRLISRQGRNLAGQALGLLNLSGLRGTAVKSDRRADGCLNESLTSNSAADFRDVSHSRLFTSDSVACGSIT